MSKDTITVNVNVYDIPIVAEQLNKLEQENTQLKEVIEEVGELLKRCIKKYGVHNMTTKDFDELLQILDKVKGE